MSIEITKKVESPEEAKENQLKKWDSLISDEVNFRVEKRGLHTYGADGGIHMSNHTATIRINPDGSETDLWVVGNDYEVVDHKQIIKQFAELLDNAGIEAEVIHQIYGGGCRVYSEFTLQKSYQFRGKEVNPFFTLRSSYDKSLKVGFMLGIKYAGRRMNISKTLYGAQAKHTKGVNLKRTLKEIFNALDAFNKEVLPSWEKMDSLVLNSDQIKRTIEDAIKKKVISKLRADSLSFDECKTTMWDIYSKMTKEVSVVRGKKGTEESAFYRNVDVGEYFSRLMHPAGSTKLESLVHGRL
jgi:hypothetical protein